AEVADGEVVLREAVVEERLEPPVVLQALGEGVPDDADVGAGAEVEAHGLGAVQHDRCRGEPEEKDGWNAARAAVRHVGGSLLRWGRRKNRVKIAGRRGGRKREAVQVVYDATPNYHDLAAPSLAPRRRAADADRHRRLRRA